MALQAIITAAIVNVLGEPFPFNIKLLKFCLSSVTKRDYLDIFKSIQLRLRLPIKYRLKIVL